MANLYTTIQGDTWSGIAYKVYGDGFLFHLLLIANPDLAHVLRFDDTPRVLVIPELEAPSNDITLPPWQVSP